MRVALITNIPRPYRTPLYEALNRHVVSANGTFRVLFYSDYRRHVRRRDSWVAEGAYPTEVVSGVELPLRYEQIVSLPTRLWPALRRFRPDVVIAGTFGPAGYLTWLYTRRAHIPYIQWSGATAETAGLLGRIAALTQGFLARQAVSSVTYGSAARRYLTQLGVRPERIITGVNTVDTTFFAQQSLAARDEALALRAGSGGSGVHLLFLGNLLARKGLGHVLEALAGLQGDAQSYLLHVVGSGPEEQMFREQAAGLGLAARVRFWGRQPSDRTPLFYALADAFILPSLEEVWGLVLNEAMACGVPVIASTLAGATCDLVDDGVNGFAVDPRDTTALAAALQRLITDGPLRTRMGAAAAQTIARKATIEHSAAAFMRAIDLAWELRP